MNIPNSLNNHFESVFLNAKVPNKNYKLNLYETTTKKNRRRNDSQRIARA